MKDELTELANVLEQIRTKSRTTVVSGEDCFGMLWYAKELAKAGYRKIPDRVEEPVIDNAVKLAVRELFARMINAVGDHGNAYLPTEECCVMRFVYLKDWLRDIALGFGIDDL